VLIHIHDADDFLDFINSYIQDLTFDRLLDIRRQTILEEAKKSQPDPEKWITLISKYTERLGPSETCVKVLKDNVLNEQGAAKTRQGIKRMLTAIKKFCRGARGILLDPPPFPRLQCLNPSCHLYC